MEMLQGLIFTWVCPKMCKIEDITNFHGSLALSCRKIGRYFKCPYYPILVNSFDFSIFVFMEMLQGLMCTWLCPKMYRTEDITNFHGPLALSSSKIASYFQSPYYAIFFNSFYFSIFPFMETLSGLICTCVCPKMCRIENITNFHCLLQKNR